MAGPVSFCIYRQNAAGSGAFQSIDALLHLQGR